MTSIHVLAKTSGERKGDGVKSKQISILKVKKSLQEGARDTWIKIDFAWHTFNSVDCIWVPTQLYIFNTGNWGELKDTFHS